MGGKLTNWIIPQILMIIPHNDSLGPQNFMVTSQGKSTPRVTGSYELGTKNVLRLKTREQNFRVSTNDSASHQHPPNIFLSQS